MFQLNAKQNAEKKYLDVLQKEGLDEEDLIRLTKPKPGKKRKIKTLSANDSRHDSRHGSTTHSVLESVHSVTQTQHNQQHCSRILMTRTNSISLEESEYEGSYASEFQQ